eukprot:scaffold68537_cov47-Cyclotella_meneghiniana.AAC.2
MATSIQSPSDDAGQGSSLRSENRSFTEAHRKLINSSSLFLSDAAILDFLLDRMSFTDDVRKDIVTNASSFSDWNLDTFENITFDDIRFKYVQLCVGAESAKRALDPARPGFDEVRTAFIKRTVECEEAVLALLGDFLYITKNQKANCGSVAQTLPACGDRPAQRPVFTLFHYSTDKEFEKMINDAVLRRTYNSTFKDSPCLKTMTKTATRCITQELKHNGVEVTVEPNHQDGLHVRDLRLFSFTLTTEEKKGDRKENTKKRISDFEEAIGTTPAGHLAITACAIMVESVRSNALGKPLDVIAFTNHYSEIVDVSEMATLSNMNTQTEYVRYSLRGPHGEQTMAGPAGLNSYKSETLLSITSDHVQMLKAVHPLVQIGKVPNNINAACLFYLRVAAGKNGDRQQALNQKDWFEFDSTDRKGNTFLTDPSYWEDWDAASTARHEQRLERDRKLFINLFERGTRPDPQVQWNGGNFYIALLRPDSSKSTHWVKESLVDYVKEFNKSVSESERLSFPGNNLYKKRINYAFDLWNELYPDQRIEKPNVNLSQEEKDQFFGNYGIKENEIYGTGEYAYDLTGTRVPLLKNKKGDGYQGVCKRGDKFSAKFGTRINGVKFDVYLGTFSNEKQAADVYSRWRHVYEQKQKEKEAIARSTSTSAITKYMRVSNDAPTAVKPTASIPVKKSSTASNALTDNTNKNKKSMTLDKFIVKKSKAKRVSETESPQRKKRSA